MMAPSQRVCGPILSTISATALFAGVDELDRMKALRQNITEIRRIWQSTTDYDALKIKIWEYIKNKELSPKLKTQIATLLTGYNDWADMDYHRPESQRHGWTAIELYCSADGYRLLFSLFNSILRQKEIDDETILITTALVEFVTIELYNFRLANIGDPHYENFEGVTYRGMTVSSRVAEDYKKAASNSDLSKRHFGVPLGFTSSSTSRQKMEEFAEMYPGDDQMYWEIHIHGLNPRLVKRYQERYPDSVVTSITAMPVGQIAELREQEILLRGAFFHIIKMESEEREGRMMHKLQLVSMNTNRDHGTELALDEGAKLEQRNFVRDMILASRFEICADLTRSHSVKEAEKYEDLAKAALRRIDALDSPDEVNSFSRSSDQVITWHGDVTGNSLPENFKSLRDNFHAAARSGKWDIIRGIIEDEYEWGVSDWLNIPAIEDPWRGRTLIHEMAAHGPPEFEDQAIVDGWQFLIEKLKECEVWRTLKTSDTAEIAEEIAQKNNYHQLAAILKPNNEHLISVSTVMTWETQVHTLIKTFMQEFQVSEETFRLPQLSVITEMRFGSAIWVPIPNTYGGFSVKLERYSLAIERIEMVRGDTRPRRTSYYLPA